MATEISGEFQLGTHTMATHDATSFGHGTHTHTLCYKIQDVELLQAPSPTIPMTGMVDESTCRSSLVNTNPLETQFGAQTKLTTTN